MGTDLHHGITAPFNNMHPPKFKAQLTNACFATVNQMFGGPSKLPTTVECAVIKSLSTVQTTKHLYMKSSLSTLLKTFIKKETQNLMIKALNTNLKTE